MSKYGYYVSIFAKKDFLKNLLLSMSFFIILFMALLISVSAFFFTINKKISPLSFSLSLIISLLIFIVFQRKYNKTNFYFTLFLSLGLIILILFSSFFTSGYFYDVSYDGRLYHQFTISHLTNGWNPFYSPYNCNGLSKNYEMKKSVWSTIYPRAYEICAANIYSVTNGIEYGKMFNLLLIFASFFIVFYLFTSMTKLSIKIILLLSALIALNPISIATLFSYYVDGFLSSILIGFFSLLVLFIREKKYIYFALLSPYTILLINTKFTGLAYAFIIIVSFMLVLLIKKYYKEFFISGLIFLLSGIFGFFFVGYSPYIVNYKKYGHPLHPVMGKNKMKGLRKRKFLEIPKNLIEKNRFEKFAISILSKSEFVKYPNETKLKFPFSVTIREIKNYNSTHVRINGWGPIFGGIFIVFLLSFLPILYFAFKKKLDYLLVLGLIAVSIVANPEFWYARFAPQVWLLPLIYSTFLILEKKKSFKYFGIILLVLLIINSIFIYIGYFPYQVKVSAKLHRQLNRLSKINRTIEMNPGIFKSANIMFYEAGIKYKTVDKISEFKRKINLGHNIEVGI